jgi:hypothetical protein
LRCLDFLHDGVVVRRARRPAVRHGENDACGVSALD